MSGDTSNEHRISPVEAKANLGRALFRRPQKHHQGQRADPTAFEALQRAAREGQQKPPTKLEMEILLEGNPSTVRTLRASGLSDARIYEFLNNQ